MLSFLKKKTDAGLTAVGYETGGVGIARIEHEGTRPRLTVCEHRPSPPDDIGKGLAQLASAHHLKKARCTTVLDETDYQLLLTEAPDVGADELKAALRWKIKDLIDFHINDATLDVFELPGATPESRSREMYAVAARNEAVQRRVDLLTGAGIGLEIIDIPELAQRNVAALLPEDAAGVVLLSLKAHSGLITITRQGYLYLSRPLNLGLDTLLAAGDPARYFDHIVLEVQRSLDYFESHFREAAIHHLVVAPLAEPLPALLEYLRANLGVTVGEMDLAQLLDSDVELSPALQAASFTIIGAALRQEVKAP